MAAQIERMNSGTNSPLFHGVTSLRRPGLARSQTVDFTARCPFVYGQAKKAGKCRFIGYTNCRDPEVRVEMLRHAERFDTALMPLHVAHTSFSESPKMSFENTALPAAIERGLGIFGIKIFGNAFLLRTFSVGDRLRYTLRRCE